MSVINSKTSIGFTYPKLVLTIPTTKLMQDGSAKMENEEENEDEGDRENFDPSLAPTGSHRTLARFHWPFAAKRNFEKHI